VIFLNHTQAATLAASGNVMVAIPGHDHGKHSAQRLAVLDAVNNCTEALIKTIDKSFA